MPAPIFGAGSLPDVGRQGALPFFSQFVSVHIRTAGPRSVAVKKPVPRGFLPKLLGSCVAVFPMAGQRPKSFI